MHGCRLLALVGLLGLGCAETPSPGPGGESPAEMGRLFDPAAAGTVQGQVAWSGDIPDVPPLRIRPVANDPRELGETRPNPHAPVIDPASRGLAGAVVFLRGVDPERSRPWDHPPVRVVMNDFRIDVVQGESRGRVGFVRRGDAVEMVSTQEVFHSLRAGGDAFWTLAFPDPDRPLTRRLNHAGVVELSSGAGYFWMSGHLFVVEHPYFTTTDAEGRFTLPRVPPGQYELVCWHPAWQVRRRDRDPESMRVSRQEFAPPLTWVQAVTVETGQTREVRVSVSTRGSAEDR
jgi:hypothetical protein